MASAAVWLYGPERLQAATDLAPYVQMDRFTLFFCFVLCAGGGLAALLAGGYLPEHKLDRGEFYPLLIFSAVGAMILASATDLLSLFLGLETMSLGVYAMTGFRLASPRSGEAAVKYFLLGSFAAAILVYGGALLYGATGHTDLVGIKQGIVALVAAKASGKLGLVVAGMALVIGGLAFKVSAVPFHMWTPDAYEGAPTPATGFMAVVVKSAAFAVLLRVLLVGFGDPGSMSWGSGWPPVVATLAVVTMTVANLTAGRQESVKRMLAYSSVAHAGYVLVGVAATVRASADAQASVLFYLMTYTFSTVGAFGALVLAGSRGKEAVSFEDLAGIGKRHPAVAAAFSLFLLSLAGVPPTAGFFGKLYIIKAAMGSELYLLSILLLLNSVLAAYYYLRVLVYMYMREPAAGAPIAVPMKSGYVATALVVASILVVGIGLLPGSSLEVAIKAALG
jgi:NADH-quinone oxidoreductase subunit N